MPFHSRSIKAFLLSGFASCFLFSAKAQVPRPVETTTSAPTTSAPTTSAPTTSAPVAASPDKTRQLETPSVLLPGTYWEERAPLKAGDVAPDWILPFATDTRGIKKGAKLDFARWRGNQETVVVFWAFWCDTWKDATRYFGSLRGELKKKDVKLVMVAVDASQQPVARPAFAAGKLFFPIAIDTKSETTARWGVRRVPSVFVIGTDSKIRATWEGLPPKKELLKLLKSNK